MEELKIHLHSFKIHLEQWLHEGIEFGRHIPPVQLYVALAVLLLTTLILLSKFLMPSCALVINYL